MLRMKLFLIASFTLLAAASPALAGSIKFSAANSFTSGINSPNCVSTGDFNGDGIPDVVVNNEFDQFAVFLGKGDGTFSGPAIYTTSFYVQSCAAVGDFNRDGKIDIVMIGGGSNSLALFSGNGDGTFNPPVYSNIALAGASVSTVVADFNKDGNLDIFIGGNGSSELILGDGNGNFTNTLFQPVSGFHLAIADFNGDGNLDVAATSPFTFSVSVLLGNGDGTFQSPITYPTLTQCDGVAAGRFGRSHHSDLAVTIDSALQVFLGNGDGSFTSSPDDLFPTGSDPGQVVAADFNNDGILDIVTADFGGDGGTVDEGTAIGPFGISLDVPTGLEPGAVAVADFNNDGSADFVVANFGDGTLSVVLNQSGTFLTVSQQPAGSNEVILNISVQGSVLNSAVPTGAVQFLEGNRLLSRTFLANGSVSFTVARPDKGNLTIQILYSGDSSFNPNTTTAKIGAEAPNN